MMIHSSSLWCVGRELAFFFSSRFPLKKFTAYLIFLLTHQIFYIPLGGQKKCHYHSFQKVLMFEMFQNVSKPNMLRSNVFERVQQVDTNFLHLEKFSKFCPVSVWRR